MQQAMPAINANKKAFGHIVYQKLFIWRNMKIRILKAFGILTVFGICYVSGAVLGELQRKNEAKNVVSNSVIAESQDWGLGFGRQGQPPTGMAPMEELKEYDTYYLGDTNQKRLYLTFDAGYENGNTPAILDALKKHQVKATFFVVGHYLETAQDQVLRMVEEGHNVGNHTYHHYDMSKISNLESFTEEMTSVENKFQEITGEEMVKYYRPPQGKYSIENLKMAKDLGYHTFFWSLAYVDWKQDDQPSREEAFEKLMSRVHPGAIVLLHSTSSTNAEILDELLTQWESEGYTFGTLDEVICENIEK